MAKTMTVAEALSVLSSVGITLGEEHADAIKELTTAAYMTRAVEIIGGNGENLPGKLVEDSAWDAEAWAKELFIMAENFANEFVGEAKKIQAGAVRMVRVVGIDTPVGHFKIELKSE